MSELIALVLSALLLIATAGYYYSNQGSTYTVPTEYYDALKKIECREQNRSCPQYHH